MYKKVTEEDILQVTKKYLGAKKRQGLEECYVKFKDDDESFESDVRSSS